MNKIKCENCGIEIEDPIYNALVSRQGYNRRICPECYFEEVTEQMGYPGSSWKEDKEIEEQIRKERHIKTLTENKKLRKENEELKRKLKELGGTK